MAVSAAAARHVYGQKAYAAATAAKQRQWQRLRRQPHAKQAGTASDNAALPDTDINPSHSGTRQFADGKVSLYFTAQIC